MKYKLIAKPDLLDELKIDYIDAERSLSYFVKACWDVLEPETELKWNWHHDLICEYLTAVDAGQIHRLIINVAPRSTKSILATVCFPLWTWLRRPHRRYIFGSYSSDLATDHSVLRRNIIESNWFQMGYSSRFQLRSDSNKKHWFANDHTGHMGSAGISGSITGKGGEGIIIDDPHNPKGADSDTERVQTIKDFDSTWSNRLNDKKTGFIILIMQRLHEVDMTQHLLDKKAGYVHVKIPTIAEERERIVFPISKRVVVREAGDYMHPERDGQKEIEQAKLDMGPYGFSGQHQQCPVPSTGGVFKADTFDFVELPDEFDYRFVTADTAYDSKKENDFTVFSAWGVKNDELYLMDCWRKQIDAADVEVPARQFIARFSSYGFRGAYIEPKGHGIYLNKALPKAKQLEVGGVMKMFPGVMIPSDTDRKVFFEDRKFDKVARANNASPHLTGRKVHFNENILDKDILLKEVLSFPKAAHDDFVDTLVDAIKYVWGRSYSGFDVQ